MKVLIVRIGAMGDVLHALPAVAALRRAHPDWTIDWAVDPRWASLLTDDMWRGIVVDQAVSVWTTLWKRRPISLQTLQSILQLRGRLRARQYDLVVDMQGTLRSAVVARLAGAKTVAGYSDPREKLATLFYNRRLARHGTHVVDQAAALLGHVCNTALASIASPLPRETLTELWADERVLSRPLCLLAPAAGWAAKQWPAERFGQLAQRLRAQGFDVAINASSPTDAVALQVLEASADAARIVVCTVAQLIALMRRTDLLIGHDSGPTHLAAALAVPLVALFGPTDPARNGPWGPGPKVVLRGPTSVTSYQRTAVPDAGLARISVDDVLAAVEGLPEAALKK